MDINDIIPDFSKLSQAEIEEVIRTTRRSRTTKKEVTLAKRPTKVAAKAKDKVASEVLNMSDDQMAMLKKLFS